MNEQAKYEKVWDSKTYRRTSSPGERRVKLLLNEPGSATYPMRGVRKILDAGCGNGRAALEFEDRGYHVWPMDIASNCLNRVPGKYFRHRFIVGSVTDLPYGSREFDLYFSSDVFEHLPPDQVNKALSEAARVAKAAYLYICLEEDSDIHEQIGVPPLHLTIRDADWWTASAVKHWNHVAHRVSGHHIIIYCRH